MEETLKSAIEKMAEMTKASADADRALKFSQAGLNLSHTFVQLGYSRNAKKV